MTKVIIISGESLDGFYERTVQYLHNKYHTHPTHLIGNKTSETEAARNLNSSGIAYRSVLDTRIQDEVPPGKTIS
jgi:hypothetical protein